MANIAVGVVQRSQRNVSIDDTRALSEGPKRGVVEKRP